MAFAHEVRYSARAFLRTPGFTVVVLLTLALGIGANTAIFTLIDGVMLSRLPVRDPDSLVLVGNGFNCCINSGNQSSFDLFAYPLYRLVRDQKDLFSGLAAFATNDDPVSIRVPGEEGGAQRADSRLVSANYFSVLGATPVLGRGFLAEEEDHPSAVAVLSYRYWARRFHGDQNILGRSIVLNSTPFTVVGVAPPQFFGETREADPTDLWVPLSMQPQIMARPDLLKEKGTYWLYTIGRLAPGVTREAAAARLTQIARTWEREGTDEKPSQHDLEDIAKTTVVLRDGSAGVPKLTRRYGDALRLLMAMVGLVLVIACCNIANLFLARATARDKEIATRIALGASNLHLVKQLLTESVMISLAGGAAGLIVAFFGSRALLAITFRSAHIMPMNSTPSLRVLLFALALSLVVGIAFGLAPAWRSANIDVFEKLHPGGSTSGFRGISLGKALVAAQIAFCLLLVVGASLFVTSFLNMQRVDLGLNESVLDVRIDPQFLNRTPEQISDLHRRIREQLLQTPGVVQAALAFYTPFSGIVWQSDMVIPGYTGGREPNRGHVTWIRVSPGYFEAAGIPVLAGRTIGEQDTAGRPRVVVISEGTRDKYFGGQNPIGRRIRFEQEPQEDDFEVIGVVGNVKVNSVREELMPTVYVSLDQKSAREATDKFIDPSFTAHDVVVRVSGDPAAMEDRVRKALQQVDPELPVSRIATFGERVALSLGRERMLTMLSVSFGVLALLLACVGLYGLMSYSLARRTKEFGIRIALGASPGRILSFVFGEVLALLIAGIVIGVPLVIGGTRYATSLLYGIGARDPRMIVAATVVLAVVAVAAGFVPARRATRVDPMVSLRIE